MFTLLSNPSVEYSRNSRNAFLKMRNEKGTGRNEAGTISSKFSEERKRNDSETERFVPFLFLFLTIFDA